MHRLTLKLDWRRGAIDGVNAKVLFLFIKNQARLMGIFLGRSTQMLSIGVDRSEIALIIKAHLLPMKRLSRMSTDT